jgi:hypothetical protein
LSRRQSGDNRKAVLRGTLLVAFSEFSIFSKSLYAPPTPLKLILRILRTLTRPAHASVHVAIPLTTVLLLLGPTVGAATLEAGYALLPGRFQQTSAQEWMPVLAVSAPLGNEVHAALSAGYVRYGTGGWTSFVPISIGIRALFKVPGRVQASVYAEGGPSLVFARWNPQWYLDEGSGKRVLMGALCRAGVLVPMRGPLSLDLSLGYLVTEYGREGIAPDAVPRPLEGISSALLQARLVLSH